MGKDPDDGYGYEVLWRLGEQEQDTCMHTHTGDLTCVSPE